MPPTKLTPCIEEKPIVLASPPRPSSDLQFLESTDPTALVPGYANKLTLDRAIAQRVTQIFAIFFNRVGRLILPPEQQNYFGVHFGRARNVILDVVVVVILAKRS